MTKEIRMNSHDTVLNDPSKSREQGASSNYLSSGRRAILDSLERTIERGRSMQIILGEEGVGKSYILNELRERLTDRCMVIYLPVARISLAEILREGLHQLDVKTNGESEAEQSALFQAVLHRIRQSGRTMVLMIDEAQFMGADVINDLMKLWREASNGSRGEVFSIVLAGTDELSYKIRPEAKEETMSLSFVRISPLSRVDTDSYIRSRFGQSTFFQDPAVEAIYSLSGGRPKSISRICAEAIERAHKVDGPVTVKMIREIGHDRFLIVSPDKGLPPPLPVQEPEGKATRKEGRIRSRGMAKVKRGLSYLRSITSTYYI